MAGFYAPCNSLTWLNYWHKKGWCFAFDKAARDAFAIEDHPPFEDRDKVTGWDHILLWKQFQQAHGRRAPYVTVYHAPDTRWRSAGFVTGADFPELGIGVVAARSENPMYSEKDRKKAQAEGKHYPHDKYTYDRTSDVWSRGVLVKNRQLSNQIRLLVGKASDEKIREKFHNVDFLKKCATLLELPMADEYCGRSKSESV